jgi:hypothetical protein
MTFNVTYYGWGVGLVVVGWFAGMCVGAILQSISTFGRNK